MSVITGTAALPITRAPNTIIGDADLGASAYASRVAAHATRGRWARIYVDAAMWYAYGTAVPTVDDNSAILTAGSHWISIPAGQAVYTKRVGVADVVGSIEIWETWPLLINTDPRAA